MYLFEDGWRDAAPAEANGSPCPRPRGGQLPLPSAEARPEVSVILSFRNMATDTVRALLSVVHNARDVGSVEVILLDIASDEGEADEIKAFVQHIIAHLELRVRLFRFSDPATASLSRAVSKAATSLATGELLLIMNCDVALQHGALRALVALFQTHPGTGMAVPKLLQPNGQILDSGGLVFSDGSGWQYGRDEPTGKPQYNYVRATDYGSSYCVMVLRQLFVDLGLYSPAYSPAWYDDTDAAFAIRAAGYDVYFTPFAEVGPLLAPTHTHTPPPVAPPAEEVVEGGAHASTTAVTSSARCHTRVRARTSPAPLAARGAGSDWQRAPLPPHPPPRRSPVGQGV